MWLYFTAKKGDIENHKIDKKYKQKVQENKYSIFYSLLLGMDLKTYELQSIYPIQVRSLIN